MPNKNTLKRTFVVVLGVVCGLVSITTVCVGSTVASLTTGTRFAPRTTVLSALGLGDSAPVFGVGSVIAAVLATAFSIALFAWSRETTPLCEKATSVVMVASLVSTSGVAILVTALDFTGKLRSLHAAGAGLYMIGGTIAVVVGTVGVSSVFSTEMLLLRHNHQTSKEPRHSKNTQPKEDGRVLRGRTRCPSCTTEVVGMASCLIMVVACEGVCIAATLIGVACGIVIIAASSSSLSSDVAGFVDAAPWFPVCEMFFVVSQSAWVMAVSMVVSTMKATHDVVRKKDNKQQT